ncbi:MAG: glycosyltransferase family 4 protein [Flavobacteriales bacterium]|nr:glycosyltransferase family 4 protein [Flavobacteriales bacterium]
MRIVVNTRLLLSNKLEGIGWFTHEVFQRVVAANPEHRFIFLFDRPFHTKFIYAPNVEGVVLPPPTRHPLLYRLWFGWLLPRKLKALKADAFISPDGYLALRSNVPTLAVLHDLNFEHYPEDLPKAYRDYYRSYFPRFARHATRLGTVSEYSRRDIAKTYGVPESRIDVIHNGVGDVYRPLSEEEKRAAALEFTGGHSYIVCIGSLNPRKNIARLLQAFDELLERHPSELRLLIVGERMWWDGRMEDAWEHMRHQDRVIFTGRLQQVDLHRALGGAMALAFVSYFEGFGIPVAEAMRCGVPVVAAEATSLPEVAGDAAHYCDPFNVSDIARALHEVCSDPELRATLSAAGIERSQRYTWDHAANALWSSFERMAKDAGLHLQHR